MHSFIITSWNALHFHKHAVELINGILEMIQEKNKILKMEHKLYFRHQTKNSRLN